MKEKNKNQNTINNRRRKKDFDFKWIFIFILIIVVIFASIYFNNKTPENIIENIQSLIETDDKDLDIDWSRYQTKNINLSETLTISQAGTYHLTGAINDGSIIVNAKEAEVRLILDNVSIRNSSGPAITCYVAEDLIIELIGQNFIEDSEEYSDNYNEDITGAIYSKDDLVFQGDGNLQIIANHQDGIVSKDDLKFNSGNYIIKSNDDGIRGKDSVRIISGAFNIESGADAIKSTNETEAKKGFVLIEEGSFIIDASAKGIKATNNIIIQNGNISLTTYDDAIHSNKNISIQDGKININAGDDGIHADEKLVIENGTIDIEKAHEGLESKDIVINNGKVMIYSTDDGINAVGNTNSITLDTDENCTITINDGEIYINSAGDGIDSNGNIIINGGTIIIDGPTNDKNGALDAGISITMNGGSVIALGSSGMAEGLGEMSPIFNISVFLTTDYPKNTKIKIVDASDETIVSHISAKSFNHMSIGTNKFELGESYTIYLNDKEYDSFIISNTTTTIGNKNDAGRNIPQQMPQKP